MFNADEIQSGRRLPDFPLKLCKLYVCYGVYSIKNNGMLQLQSFIIYSLVSIRTKQKSNQLLIISPKKNQNAQKLYI